MHVAPAVSLRDRDRGYFPFEGGGLPPCALPLLRGLFCTRTPAFCHAGSRGVYGLDDYHHLPFLFGAAQLCGNAEGIRPGDAVQPEVAKLHAEEYMYLSCIDWIMSEKRGHFPEHSPTLYDISGVAEWSKILSGMNKMYRGEVLAKFPIMQHLLFGALIRFDPKPQGNMNAMAENGTAVTGMSAPPAPP